MKTAKVFLFKSYSIGEDRKSFYFDYSVGFEDGQREDFREKILFPRVIPPDVSSKLLDSALHGLHIALGISYWKLYCPPEIKIETNALSQDQALFWNTVYTKGLGEFFFKNNIDFEGLVNFPWQSESATLSYPHSGHGSLVGIGGGKDSLVTVELLKAAGKAFTPLVIETNKSYDIIDRLMPLIDTQPLTIKRFIDNKVALLNSHGQVYNGHVPISAIYAFIGILTAAIYGFSHFIASNERSANYGNVTYKGGVINHQWSKSLEFEKMFDAYVKEYISPDLFYFSLLRPLWEIQVTKLFSSMKKYFSFFSSCNRNFSSSGIEKGKKWCGVCSKCAFVFSMMSAFLPKSEVLSVFERNLYEDTMLETTYSELLGIGEMKPFDCVGTPEEVRVAFFMAMDRGEYKKDAIMTMFEKKVLPLYPGVTEEAKKLLTSHGETAAPSEFADIVKI